MTTTPNAPRDRAEELHNSMLTLASLAGWRTVPHVDDAAVVRLALTVANERHDPNTGGNPEIRDLLHSIELRWLDRGL